ncbi:MAG: hypothetical protein AB1439_00685 [candidate division FCPU426 bacterium]
MSFSRNTSLSFAAGALGGLTAGLTLWALGQLGISRVLHVAIAPALTVSFLFGKVVWGGLWGFLLWLPILKSRTVWRGLVLSLFPTLVQLIYVFPQHTTAGMFGLNWGQLAPLVVLAANAAGGIAAAWWHQSAK